MTAAQRRAANTQALHEALQPVRLALLDFVGMEPVVFPVPENGSASHGDASGLAHLYGAVRLNRFEMDVVLLCVGVHMDPQMRDALRSLHPDGQGEVRPNVELALRICRQPDWNAFAPSARLRADDIVTLRGLGSLLDAELILDEAVLHLLVGLDYWDRQLMPMLTFVPSGPCPESHAETLDDLEIALVAQPAPLIWLRAPHAGQGLRLVSAAAEPHFCLNAAALPRDAGEVRRLGIRFRRMLRILDGVGSVDPGDAPVGLLRAFLEAVGGPLVVLEPGEDMGGISALPVLTIDLPRLDVAGRRTLWRHALDLGEDQQSWSQPLADNLAEDFDLPPEHVDGLAGYAQAAAEEMPPETVARRLRQRGRGVARVRLDRLATRVPVRGDLGQVLLSSEAREVLEAIRDHMAARACLHGDRQGGGAAGDRATGVTALFAGASGTGKTLAAEKLAADLDLDLYRVDLSQTVSKWVGETEKNLRAIFDAADAGGAILLFDEADTLFAKRGDGRESGGGQFTNSVVGFLLQEMERYRGLAILTTNRRAAIDDAFQRRLRYVIDFPFPSRDDRIGLWRAAVPQSGLDLDALAAVPLSGGQIAALSVVAASRAAAAGRGLCMDDLLFAMRLDFTKNGVSHALLPCGGGAR